ncbi:HlyD family secretion protein [Aquifex sp.]
MKKIVYLTLFLLVLIPSVIYGIKWINFRLTHVISNAAFVESDVFVKVAFKRVGGRIEKLFKEEGNYVRVGDPLAKLEDEDYRVKLKGIIHEINSVEEKLEALKIKKKKIEKKLNLSLEILAIKREQILHEINSLEVNLKQLKRDYRRYLNLFKKGVIPRRKYEEVETKLRSLQEKLYANKLLLAEIDKEREKLLAEYETVKELEKEIRSLEERLRALYTKKKDTENLLRYTLLRSPVDGYIVKKFFNEGELVAQGQYVYAVYDPRDAYILVLLDERKLEGVKVGNKVKIKIDAYPDKEYEGVVKEIGKAAAAKFAIIPRDITAGEFTKVSQRIPIKIEITKGDKSILKLGMGAEVIIEKR